MGRQTALRRTGALRAGTTSHSGADGVRRRLLLAGTAIATTFMVSTSAAEAQQAVFVLNSPFSQNINNADDCIFVGSCAVVTTIGPGASINLTNSGDFATIGPAASSIFTSTLIAGRITINNSGDLATAGGLSAGISAATAFGGAINITNTGDIATAGLFSYGIYALATTVGAVNITNSGALPRPAATPPASMPQPGASPALCQSKTTARWPRSAMPQTVSTARRFQETATSPLPTRAKSQRAAGMHTALSQRPSTAVATSR
ncbi:hypothetical protein [Methyloceanibacter sp. wino2]|uniref:hypothetical protein n=1 Tax=Methyloceanibacter sp. wino2 TaxID=2170729 RepID=UPI00131F08B3|nr:hypothetical protein [Methyloceanibacter sp. wino2]